MSHIEYLDTGAWSDPDVEKLSSSAWLFYIWSFTNDWSWAGLYRVSQTRMLESKLTTEQIPGALRELSDGNFLHYVGDVLWVRARVKRIRTTSPGMALSIAKDVAKIAAEHPLRRAFLSTYADVPWLRKSLAPLMPDDLDVVEGGTSVALQLDLANLAQTDDLSILSPDYEHSPSSTTTSTTTSSSATTGGRAGARKEADEESAPEVVRLCNLLLDKIAADGTPRPTPSPTAWKKWCVECRRLMEIEGASVKQIEYVIDWVHTPGGFWSSKVLSMEKLRKHWVALVKEIKRTDSKRTRPTAGDSIADLERLKDHL